MPPKKSKDTVSAQIDEEKVEAPIKSVSSAKATPKAKVATKTKTTAKTTVNAKVKVTAKAKVNAKDATITQIEATAQDEKPKKIPRKRIPRRRAMPMHDEQTDSEYDFSELPTEMPLLPLRDVVVFNNMIVPLFVGRDISIQAVEAAATASQHLFLCGQRDEATEDPTAKDLYEVGTVAQILRLLKMPDGRVKALVQGVARARIETIHFGPCITVSVTLLPDPQVGVASPEDEALVRLAREQCERILSLRGIPTADIMGLLMNVSEPSRLADLVAANLRLKNHEAQALLECLDPIERLRIVIKHLSHELEVAQVQAKIQSSTKEGIDKAQRDYFLREQLNAIRKELGDTSSHDEEVEAITEALNAAELPEEARKEADKQLKRLASMHNDSSEASVVRTYLDWLSELPWSVLSEDQLDIVHAQTILDEDHFGLDKVKDRILEFLSVRKLNPDSKGSILCFVGPPGVGKTSLGRSIARALGRKFYRVSLGGMRDEAEIRGHRRTYVGAMPGRIIQALKQVGTRNPVVMFDEIDKLGSDFRGDPSSALLEVLDPEQNISFSDHYLNVPFDLSKVLFICTANQLETIPPALRDRLEVIKLSGYTAQEKLVIAKTYIVPKQITENGLESDEITLGDALITRLIREYTREAGLRNMEREVGSVCRKMARRKAEGEAPPFKVSQAMLTKLLGPPHFLDEDKETSFGPGVAIGLAYTPYGGEVLHIEVCTMPGKGQLLLTGQLGDVMKESAQAAMSYARSHATALGLVKDVLSTTDLHVHVPAGATPKDGPSAGVTLVSALLSALTGKALRPDTCMTGEITLRGRILPVGGIKEKILAGVTYGLEHVIIPKQNVKDLAEVPADLLRKITVHPISTLDELLPLVFGQKKSAPKQSKKK